MYVTQFSFILYVTLPSDALLDYGGVTNFIAYHYIQIGRTRIVSQFSSPNKWVVDLHVFTRITSHNIVTCKILARIIDFNRII